MQANTADIYGPAPYLLDEEEEAALADLTTEESESVKGQQSVQQPQDSADAARSPFVQPPTVVAAVPVAPPPSSSVRRLEIQVAEPSDADLNHPARSPFASVKNTSATAAAAAAAVASVAAAAPSAGSATSVATQTSVVAAPQQPQQAAAAAGPAGRPSDPLTDPERDSGNRGSGSTSAGILPVYSNSVDGLSEPDTHMLYPRASRDSAPSQQQVRMRPGVEMLEESLQRGGGDEGPAAAARMARVQEEEGEEQEEEDDEHPLPQRWRPYSDVATAPEPAIPSPMTSPAAARAPASGIPPPSASSGAHLPLLPPWTQQPSPVGNGVRRGERSPHARACVRD